jgi:hypothetical protein
MTNKKFEVVIDFDSLDIAKKIASHLKYVEIDTTVDRPQLKFTRFDVAAFNLALALEKVTTGWKIILPTPTNLIRLPTPAPLPEWMWLENRAINTYPEQVKYDFLGEIPPEYPVEKSD